MAKITSDAICCHDVGLNQIIAQTVWARESGILKVEDLRTER